MLQRVILVNVDGVIGEQTINTVNAGNWANAFIQARINYYKQIATGRNLVFLNGWLNRVQNTTKAL
jgi:lysozyme family protein